MSKCHIVEKHISQLNSLLVKEENKVPLYAPGWMVYTREIVPIDEGGRS